MVFEIKKRGPKRYNRKQGNTRSSSTSSSTCCRYHTLKAVDIPTLSNMIALRCQSRGSDNGSAIWASSVTGDTLSNQPASLAVSRVSYLSYTQGDGASYVYSTSTNTGIEGEIYQHTNYNAYTSVLATSVDKGAIHSRSVHTVVPSQRILDIISGHCCFSTPLCITFYIQ